MQLDFKPTLRLPLQLKFVFQFKNKTFHVNCNMEK